MQFNEKQQIAIDTPFDKAVIVAPPGSGKTATLTGAIQAFVEQHPFKKVVAITFTKKAAAELSLKLYNYPQVEKATIHAWSLRELNKLAAKYGFKVDMLTDEQVLEIGLMCARKLGYFSLNNFYLSAFLMGNKNMDMNEGEKAKLRRVYDVYVQYKRDNQLYDFTDLPLYLFDMLNHYGETIIGIDALFVDEFQDVDAVQAQIFTAVDAKKHFYIGDPDQSIYMFRGAEEGILNTLTDFERYTLDVNYRSFQSIVDFATQLRITEDMMTTDKPGRSWIRCQRQEEEGEVYVYNGTVAYDVVKEKHIDSELLLKSFMQRRPYILCRSNKQVKAIEKLGYTNVSTVHKAKGLEYTSVIAVDFPIGDEETLNIAYVSCTRAKDALMIVDFDKFITHLNTLITFEEISFKVESLF